MDEKDTNNSFKLIKIGRLIYSWRKFLISAVIGLSIFAVTYSLIMPKTFNSTAVVLPPSGASPMSNLFGQQMTKGLGGAIGAIIQGGGGRGASRILSILHSRNLAEKVIHKFNLQERWGTPTIDDAVARFQEKVAVSIDDQGMVQVVTNLKTKFLHPDKSEKNTRQLTKDVTQYIIDALDKKYTKLQTQNARYQRQVIEKRFNETKKELRNAELALKKFNEKHGVISLPEQLKATVKAAAQLKSKIMINQIQLESLEKTYQETRPEIKQRKIRINSLQERLKDFSLGEYEGKQLNVFPGFEGAPELALRYGRLKRDVEVQSTIYKFLAQQYESIKLQEAKETPTIQLINTPSVPVKRASPSRSLLCIVIVGTGTLLALLFATLYEFARRRLPELMKQIKQEEV